MIFLALLLLAFPLQAFARVTPGDLYQQKRDNFASQLSKIEDTAAQEKIRQSDRLLSQINSAVTTRFEGDIEKLSAVLLEIKKRKGVEGMETVVAFGQAKNQLQKADYSLTFAHEALAFQKTKDYTPLSFSPSNWQKAVHYQSTLLSADLKSLAQKILQAKVEVRKALDEK